MKRLLFVVNNPEFFLTHRLALALAAQREGFEVHVATPPKGDLEEVRRHGLIHHCIPLDRSRGRPWQEWKSILSLVTLFRRIRPDIAHLVTIKPILYGSLAARFTGVPSVVNAVSGLGYVFIAKGLKAGLVRRAVMLAYKHAFRHPNFRVIFQNPDDADVFTSKKLVQMNDVVFIKGSGVDPTEFHPRPEPIGLPLVLFPSRMLWDKGLREFVAAAEILIVKGVKARFVLAGEVDPGNPASADSHWLENAQARGAVEWWGRRKDMSDVLNQAHIICLPSYREGLPKVLIEAAACGRPIVTTDTPGCREIVRDGYNGLLVPHMDATALSLALLSLIEDPELRRRMGARGRQRAQEEFSLEIVVRKTMSIYRELADSSTLNGKKRTFSVSSAL